MENAEVEKKGVGKTKVGLIACALLVVILTGLSVWFYTRIDILQNQIDTLETDKNNLQNQVSNLQTDKSQLEINISNLQSENSQLESEIDLLNSEYDYYVSTHQYTNWEYDEAQFSFYYVVPTEQKFGVYDLEDELWGFEWIEPYQEDVFDCSEMSAYLEWELENKGWHTFIIIGDSPFGSGYHAWLLVETSTDGYMPVESTTIEIVWWDDPNFDNYFDYDYAFETIQDALDYSETEFDWWKD